MEFCWFGFKEYSFFVNSNEKDILRARKNEIEEELNVKGEEKTGEEGISSKYLSIPHRPNPSQRPRKMKSTQRNIYPKGMSNLKFSS